MALHTRFDVATGVALALCALAGGCQPRESEGALPMHAILGPDGLMLHTRGEARRLAEADSVDTSCFDRDAKALIVTHGRELARITLDGERTTLLRADGEVRFPDVSPRDGRIALSLQVAGRDHLFLRAPDGVESAPFGIGARLAAFAPAPPQRGTLAARLADARDGTIALDDLTTLGRADARLLGGWRGTSLTLRGLRRLEAPCARELARFEGALDLSGLEDLDAVEAAVLSGYSANGEGFILRLDGLADPRPEALQALAAIRGWGLALGGLRKLDDRVTPLSGIAVAWLELGGLIELDVATAAQIAAHWRNKWLVLSPSAQVAPGAEAILARAQITLRRLP